MNYGHELLFYSQESVRNTIIAGHVSNGVNIPCPDGVIISPDSKIGAGTLILPGTIICGDTQIGTGCTVGPNSVIRDCRVGADSTLNASQCENSVIGSGVSIGPFAHLRPDTVIDDGVRIGNFAEIKNSRIGKKTSVSHLSYIGDSDVGEGVNIGCGCATANYDGTEKFRTKIGNRVFVGCHTCMVAPVALGDGSYTAAGSVITDTVPEGTMAIARSRQTIKRKVRKYNES